MTTHEETPAQAQHSSLQSKVANVLQCSMVGAQQEIDALPLWARELLTDAQRLADALKDIMMSVGLSSQRTLRLTNRQVEEAREALADWSASQ